MATFPFRSTRDWVEYLEENEQLVKVQKEVDLNGEIAAISRKGCKENAPAIMFENVKGYPGWRVLCNTFTNRERIAAALGVDPNNMMAEVSPKVDGRVPPVEVSWGPCKELKFFGDDVDLTRLPIPFIGSFEGSPNITAGVSNKLDVETDWQNVAVRRFGLKGKRTLSEFINPAQQDFSIWATYRREKKKMPIAIVISPDPVSYIASQAKTPVGVCEYDLWGAFTGMPLEMVKCETSELLVPATAEIIIEGEIDFGDVRELDGPVPEHVGYYTTLAAVARVDVKCVTMRKDPIFYFMDIGQPPTEGHAIGGTIGSISIYRELVKSFPGILDVHSHGWTFTIVKVAKSMKDWPQFALSVGNVVKFGIYPDRKGVFIVDEDVEDISDYYQVMTAMMSKFQASKDLTIIPRTVATCLDPSEPWAGNWGWQDFFVMDCTTPPAPYDEGYRRGRAVPPKEIWDKITRDWKEYGFKK